MNSQNAFKISQDIIASKQTRFTNYVVDYLVQILITGILVVLVGIFAEFTDQPNLLSWIDDINKIQEYIFGAVISIIYYAIFESFTARSAGKYVTNTIVVLEDGTKPPTETLLRRALYRIVPLNALCYLWAPEIWHDKYTDTFVVSKSGLKSEIQMHNNLDEIGTLQD